MWNKETQKQIVLPDIYLTSLGDKVFMIFSALPVVTETDVRSIFLSNCFHEER